MEKKASRRCDQVRYSRLTEAATAGGTVTSEPQRSEGGGPGTSGLGHFPLYVSPLHLLHDRYIFAVNLATSKLEHVRHTQ